MNILSTYFPRSNHLSFLSCFVFLVFSAFRPTVEFFTHMETSPLPVKGCKFDLYSALVAIEQWLFSTVSHLLWHRHPFKIVNSEITWHSYLLPNVCNRAVTTCLDDLGLSWPDIELRSPASEANVTALLMHWNYLT